MLEHPRIATGARTLPTGTVAFLFTDVEGSTQRWETHGVAMGEAIERLEGLLEASIAAHEGYVFKRMGDSFCAAFRTAPEAIAAACEAQRKLVTEDFSSVDGLKVRMAVHVGHAEERGGDYFGPTVNRVARLLAIGYGGQVLVSGAAADLSQGEMPRQSALRDLGSHRLKDLAHPEQVYQLVAPDLPQKFFPLRSLDALPNNLPLQLTAFVGREDEIERVIELVAAHRLTTLVGTGGVGKTRLSLQVGADVLDRYEDGVWFVELAPLSDGTLIVNELAPLFGVQATDRSTLLDGLLTTLRAKHALLIVDNCEHLVDPAAEIIEKILRGCPKIHVLATSREALKIAGESVHRVASLDEQTAIALFAERANAATGSFVLTADNRPTVTKICRRLDGIALAIELAAARIRALDVEELFVRLDERFRILTGGSRTALPRQQTMRALIDWSYDLLLAPEQALLRRVAVFAGGWTLDEASVICADDDVQAWDVLDQLTSLVDKSLVVAELSEAATGTSKLRYRLLESTRQYAAEKLSSSGEVDRFRLRHAQYFADFMQRASKSWSTTPSRLWQPPILAEIDNLRAALDWTLAEKRDAETGAIIAGESAMFWHEVGMDAEGKRYCETALAMEDRLSPRTAALVWFALSMVCSTLWGEVLDASLKSRERYEALGDSLGAMRAQVRHGEALIRLRQLEQAGGELDEALRYFTNAGEGRWANYALSSLGRSAMWNGDVELARERTAEVLQAARSQGDERLAGVAQNNLAEQEFALGNTDRAIELATAALEPERANRDVNSICIALTNLSAYLISAGRPEEARPLAHEALSRACDLQSPGATACSIQHLAAIAAHRGEYERSALLLGCTNARFDPIFRESTEQREYDATINILRAALGDARMSALLQRGATMQQEQAISDALQI